MARRRRLNCWRPGGPKICSAKRFRSSRLNADYRRKKKKLIVAFHFQLSNAAGWKCDACRKSGLERKRRCGWLPEALEAPAQIVWARKQVATDVCPKSLITAASLGWIEAFLIWKRLHLDL